MLSNTFRSSHWTTQLGSASHLLRLLTGVLCLISCQAFAQIQHLGDHINSPSEEYYPIPTPDGQRLYFSRINHPDNTFGQHGSEDTWMSVWDPEANEWGLAQHLSGGFNQEQSNLICGISPDGQWMLVRGASEDGYFEQRAFSIRERTEEGWGAPQKLQIEGLKEMVKGTYLAGTLSPDLQVLVMYFSEIPNDNSNDLYVSFREDNDTWTAPVPLGPDINTAYNESGPFIAADNRTLYFNSNRPGGLGEEDIYRSVRLDESWAYWSTPENLGSKVNSPGLEANFVMTSDEKYAFLASEYQSMGETDLVRITLEAPEESVANSTARFRGPMVHVEGKVINSETETPLFAGLTCQSLPSMAVLVRDTSSVSDGSFKFSLPAGGSYLLIARAQGHQPGSAELDLTRASNGMIYPLEVRLRPGDENAPILPGSGSAYEKPAESETLITTIYYTSGSIKADEEAHREIDRLAELLKSNPELRIAIHGHTDRLGNSGENLELSEKRARMVRAYLIAVGISPNRLTYMGFGNNRPVASNQEEEGRAQNRRVEFHMIP
ncbi:OmpA family protein [Pontibacter sp. G13]|uniref:OmpA family protein n=1 Tax=Pontibacter sp. G13 TaxID=3074898 RepID=UPI00288BBAA7|nr:OmpA family protein [Pontibacter sp. G13]WNJ16183.1 OmpA family protein [Pontibacter sp. G13]